MTPYEQALDIIHSSPYFAFHSDCKTSVEIWEELSVIIQKYGLHYTLRSDGYYHLSGEQPVLKVDAIIADKERLTSE
jgi:hypothetical protein